MLAMTSKGERFGNDQMNIMDELTQFYHELAKVLLYVSNGEYNIAQKGSYVSLIYRYI